jgi:hypothetical protein
MKIASPRLLFALFLMLLPFGATQAHAQVRQLAELTASDGAAFDEFGFSVAISGNTAVVGVPKLLLGGEAAAYVFVKSGTTWKQVAELQDGVSNDELGFSVSISGDANTIVAGAPNSASDGTVYVFVKPAGGWQDTPPTATLTVAGGQVHFGDSVAISSDGTTIVAGVDGEGGVGLGAAYVFVEPEGGWVNMTNPTATLTSSSGFEVGYSVALSGNTIVAGEANTGNLEAAYVFVKPAGGWVSTTQPNATLTASDETIVDAFGYSVAISGNTAVVGAPFHPLGKPGAAYVFVEPHGGWKSMTQTAELTLASTHTLLLGQAVAAEGGLILVGAPDDPIGHNNMQGAVFGYVKPPSGWVNSSTPVGSVTSSHGAADDLFGDAIAVNGTIAVIGAPQHQVNGQTYQGAAYVFGEL